MERHTGHRDVPSNGVFELYAEAALYVRRELEDFSHSGHKAERHTPSDAIVKDLVGFAVTNGLRECFPDLVGESMALESGVARILSDVWSAEGLAEHRPLRACEDIDANVALAGRKDERRARPVLRVSRGHFARLLVSQRGEQRAGQRGLLRADVYVLAVCVCFSSEDGE